jgi:hypothetical protein
MLSCTELAEPCKVGTWSSTREIAPLWIPQSECNFLKISNDFKAFVPADTANSIFQAGPHATLGVAGQTSLMDLLVTYPPPDPQVDAATSKKTKRNRKKPDKMPYQGGALVSLSEKMQVESSTVPEVNATTVMIRHIACCYLPHHVTGFLDEAGMGGKYDLVYLPLNVSKKANLGYAFVNFLSPSDVDVCKEKFDGRVFGTSLTEKKCQVVLARMQYVPADSKRSV